MQQWIFVQYQIDYSAYNLKLQKIFVQYQMDYSAYNLKRHGTIPHVTNMETNFKHCCSLIYFLFNKCHSSC
ncbi:hypothetical protein PsorP6_003219 [Peronosclerospora sorghi]|uniref:Uncharacterized protein n=1 Tax=Peronosclerospora sorghi TaxID=230839 RepID=A0ACC0VMS3_9STRA|nr:hypothetical protein PsorP6_003219 [Peronosclerospora sorghi]